MTVEWQANIGLSVFWHKAYNSISDKTAKNVSLITGISTGLIKLYPTTTRVFSV
jgi:hypothetical protein